jgi:hypothetical protein
LEVPGGWDPSPYASLHLMLCNVLYNELINMFY